MKTFALAGVLCLGAALAAPVPPPREAQLLFAQRKGDHYQLTTIRQDGGGEQILNEAPESRVFPAVTRDGRFVAYTVVRDGVYQLVVSSPDGKNQKKLSREGFTYRGPAWSPDGKKLAFTRVDRNGQNDVCVSDADGGNVVNLTDHRAFDADPCWSPDGKKVAFVSDRAGDGFRLFVVDADGKNTRQLTDQGNGFGCVYPSWSPDGKKLAYAHQAANGALEIFTCNPDGGNRKQLTSQGGINVFPAWSPDGKKLAFQHHEPNSAGGDLCLIDAAGKNFKQLTRAAGCPMDGGRPCWRVK